MNKAGVNRLVDEIFREALALPSGERDRFVRQRCANNPEMARRIKALLAASDTPDDELSGPLDNARENLWRDVIVGEDSEGEDLSGQRVHEWRIVRRLARGGLATVYLAEREGGAFEQKAAFKVLRRGLDTDDVVARFRAERQILSTLEHPSIARILDGGALDDGRPYLVLEFVDGLPITRYCEDNGIDIRGRARLVMDVLEALHHAHRHLVVHRDIKPSNILVTAEGRVSLLDFGISKLLDPEAMPGAATLTRTGIALLTPGYGSPEQHAGKPITTASDIYQVGLIAYQLVTGKRPFDGPRRPGDAAAIAPSRAMGEMGDRREVAGDLDAIIGKSLHDEPDRRYDSALDMRDDLQRYLDHRPVLARPDSLAYRFVKLARRRPWLVPIVLVGLLAVASYLMTITLYSRQLEFEKRRALAAESFMVNLLESPDPFAPADPQRGSSITVVEALDLGVERLRAAEVDDVALRATLLDSIAGVYASLDQPDKAIALGEEGLSLERGVFGDESAEVLDSLSMLAGQYQTKGDYDTALRYRDEEMMLVRRLYSGSDPRVGAAEANLASLQVTLGNLDEGRRLYEKAIEKLRQTPTESARPLINALVGLSELVDKAAPAQAAALLHEAEALAIELFGRQSLSMALIHARAGSNASNQRKFDESETAFRAALEIYESRLGRAHGATVSAVNNLAVLLMRKGDLTGAEQAFRELLELSEHKYGAEHRQVASHYQNLATVIGRQERFVEALPLHRRAYEIFSETLPDHYMTAYPLISIAYAELQGPDAEAAERAARQALKLLGTSATNRYAIGVANCLAGLALERQGFTNEGAEMLVEARVILAELPVDPVYRQACRL
jgi:eukaryotic-like serine/threonine-protein kinase